MDAIRRPSKPDRISAVHGPSYASSGLLTSLPAGYRTTTRSPTIDPVGDGGEIHERTVAHVAQFDTRAILVADEEQGRAFILDRIRKCKLRSVQIDWGGSSASEAASLNRKRRPFAVPLSTTIELPLPTMSKVATSVPIFAKRPVCSSRINSSRNGVASMPARVARSSPSATSRSASDGSSGAACCPSARASRAAEVEAARSARPGSDSLVASSRGQRRRSPRSRYRRCRLPSR